MKGKKSFFSGRKGLEKSKENKIAERSMECGFGVDFERWNG